MSPLNCHVGLEYPPFLDRSLCRVFGKSFPISWGIMANPWGAPVNLRPLITHHCNVKVEGGRKRQNDTQHSTECGEEVLLAKKNLGSAGQPKGAAGSDCVSQSWVKLVQKTSRFVLKQVLLRIDPVSTVSHLSSRCLMFKSRLHRC